MKLRMRSNKFQRGNEMILKKYKNIFTLVFVICSFLVACNAPGNQKETIQNLPSSEIVFEALTPAPLGESDAVILEIIDEVTGIALNPTRYAMQKKDDRSVYARIPIINGSIVKYRYVLSTETDVIEKNAVGEQVSYRTFYVNRPSIVKDLIQSWSAKTVEPARGEISGYVYDQKTDLPVADMIISVNGNMTYSGANGFYELSHLPVGEFLLTAFHPDGEFEPFQQGAVIAENALTPASFGMRKAEKVNVEFIVSVPENTPDGAVVRLIGNTFLSGNSYSILQGGTSDIPSRAPVLTFDKDRTYKLTLQLPAGMDFRYKFSLGSGFINAERAVSRDFITRQYIVPNRDARVSQNIQTWSPGSDTQPITFTVQVPENTPQTDIVSLQFNPFVWMQPVPMWNNGNDLWSYTLFGPFEYLSGAQFRVCRNDQCGYADDALTAGDNAGGFILDESLLTNERMVFYQIDNWKGLEQSEYQVQSAEFAYDKPGFFKAVAFSDQYNPFALPYLEWGFIEAAISGANSILITPSWNLSAYDSSPMLRNLPGNSYNVNELKELHTYAQESGMQMILFPQLRFENETIYDYWEKAPLTFNFWSDWFDSYSQFILNYAYLSEQLGLNTLVIGGSSISPSLPNGILPSGNPSNTPYDMNDRWLGLISEIRKVYQGRIIFAISDDLGNIDKYGFLKDVDSVLLLMDAALSSTNSPNLDQLESGAADFLDNRAIKLVQTTNKPVMLGLLYASVDGSASNCANLPRNCAGMLDRSSRMTLSSDLNEQADIYSAIISESLKRDWISGIFSMLFDPAVIVRDAGYSIRGKPAYDVFSYFNNRVIK